VDTFANSIDRPKIQIAACKIENQREIKMGTRGGKRIGAGRKSNAHKLLEAGFVCKAFSPEIQEKTWKSLLASNDENIVLKTMTYLTDRVYGKAIQRNEVTGSDGGPLEFLALNVVFVDDDK
jgi:hypothetical protein